MTLKLLPKTDLQARQFQSDDESGSSETRKSQRVFFPGLNQVRALAAFSVLFCHVEQIKRWYGLKHPCPLLELAGVEGVPLFFVLSSFLITYLLFEEQSRHEKIDIKKFYLRRICRIWPLYYFVVVLSFFVLPHFWQPPSGFLTEVFTGLYHNFWTKLLLFATFLPGLCSVIYPPVLFASQCWSLGVEELFYLGWPSLVAKCRRFFVKACLGILGLKATILCFIEPVTNFLHLNERVVNGIKGFILQFDAEAFVVGGLAAWLFVNKPKFVQKWFLNPIVLLAIASLIFFGVASSGRTCVLAPWDCPFQPILVRAAFALMIISFALKPANLGPFTPFVDYLGRISYGLYMYHWGVAAFVAQWVMNNNAGRRFELADDVFFYSTIIATTICIAAISFKFLEEPFLKMKKKMAVVQTI